MKQHIKTVKEFKKCILDANITISAQHSEAIDEVVKGAERTEELEKFIIWLVDDYGYQEHPINILKRAEALMVK